MIIIEDIRRLFWEVDAFIRRQPRIILTAYIITVSILFLALWHDASSIFSPFADRLVYVSTVMGRCHLLGLMFYGFYRYFVWAKNNFISGEARVTSMRRDTMNAIAHEVRTPLSAILGYAENLRLGICEDKKDYYLEQIEIKGHEISRMIDEILSIAKLEDAEYSLNPEKLSMNALIYKLTAEADASFEIMETGEWIIDADRKSVSRMLRCLIDNAVRYREPGTRISVSLSSFGMRIHNVCEPLDDEQLKHIFEFNARNDGRYSFGLFFSHKAAAGSGMKLRICNENDGVTVSLY